MQSMVNQNLIWNQFTCFRFCLTSVNVDFGQILILKLSFDCTYFIPKYFHLIFYNV